MAPGVSTYSYKDKMTTLWAEVRFDVTRSTSGIYSIIAGVWQLTEWVTDVYIYRGLRRIFLHRRFGFEND